MTLEENLEPQGEPRGRLRRLLWLVGLLLSVVASLYLSGLFGRWLGLSPMAATGVGQVSFMLLLILFAAADGGGFRSLGVTGVWRGYDAAVIVGVLVTQTVGSGLTALILQQLGVLKLEGRAVMDLFQTFSAYPFGAFVAAAFALALLAGVGEELIFRGYVITRLERLGLGPWGCILLSALTFGLVHWPGYGLLPALSKAVWFGIPTGAYFWYRRNLGPLMVAHTLLDFLGFLLVYAVGKFAPGLPGL
jgi:membrane protease YdiL (CAAX protease family)